MTSISSLWTTLDPTVQQWLLQNPGTMVLPRTYVNQVQAGEGQVLGLDEHGEHWLSADDMIFLKNTREQAPRSVTSPSPGLPSVTTGAGRPPADPQVAALDQ
jgi:hypothetical protein